MTESVHVHQAWVTGAHSIYIARCNCGWGSPTRFYWSDAYRDKVAHIGGSDGEADDRCETCGYAVDSDACWKSHPAMLTPREGSTEPTPHIGRHSA